MKVVTSPIQVPPKPQVPVFDFVASPKMSRVSAFDVVAFFSYVLCKIKLARFSSDESLYKIKVVPIHKWATYICSTESGSEMSKQNSSELFFFRIKVLPSHHWIKIWRYDTQEHAFTTKSKILGGSKPFSTKSIHLTKCKVLSAFCPTLRPLLQNQQLTCNMPKMDDFGILPIFANW